MAVSDSKAENSQTNNRYSRLRYIGAFFTLAGIGLFAYFIYSVGLTEILDGIAKIGVGGFAVIVGLYFLRILVRGAAWRLAVHDPHKLRLFDTVQAVIIGEALSTVIPLGILVSGTAKAIAVRRRVPLIVGFSSVATENLFYSLVTGLFIAFGAAVFLYRFDLSESWVWTLGVLVAAIFALIVLGFLMVIRQWNWASGICDKLYDAGIARNFMGKWRMHVRLFENLIYGFYRQHPKRFLPIFLFQVLFHALGVAEVWFILNRLSGNQPEIGAAFLLESVSRLITVVFKLVPFLIGVDEAGAQFVTETLGLGVGLGVMLAIVRKGRILFWAVVGILTILLRGLSIREIFDQSRDSQP